MSDAQSQTTVYIVNPVPDSSQPNLEIRGPVDALRGFIGGKSIDLTTLSDNATIFFKDMALLFKDADSYLKNYQLDEIELSVTITSSGKLSLLAASAEGGVQGGIKLVFKRAENK